MWVRIINHGAHREHRELPLFSVSSVHSVVFRISVNYPAAVQSYPGHPLSA